MTGYILALLPIYIFIYLPLSQILFPSSLSPSSSLHDGSFNEYFIAPEDPDLTCPEHTYVTHILSREPLVVYIEGFLTEAESDELLDISNEYFTTSSTSTGPDHKIDPSIRDSEVATLPRSPRTVRCIEARARAFQGWSFGAQDGLLLERLKIQKYGVGGHYTHHYDWQGVGRVDRVSSFLTYVHANCTGGETAFPRLRPPVSSSSTHGGWCRFIQCGEQEGGGAAEGVAFKPIRGNAVFWENLRGDGTGYTETWHAGLPVRTGTKVGLNIWSWYRF